MNRLCEKYAEEFSARLIAVFSIDASIQKLMEMWTEVVSDARVTIEFANGAVKVGHSSKIDSSKIDSSKIGCSKILSSGANKGSECGKKCGPDSPFCTKHCQKDSAAAKSEDVKSEIVKSEIKTCVYVMVSGAKKGSACGKKCADDDMCKVHIKSRGSAPAKNKNVDENTVENVDENPVENPSENTGDAIKELKKEPVVVNTTYKVTFKKRENGLLAAINATPSGSIFVFNNTKDRLISGKLSPDERVIDLDDADVKFCTDNNLKMVSSKRAIEDILDEIQDI